MENQTKTEALPVLTTAQVIEQAVASFSSTEVTNAKIDEIKAVCNDLKIEGEDDKKGYKAVGTARIRVKNLRLAVQRKETELLEVPKKYTVAVKAEAVRLIAMLKPIEDELKLKQDAIDDITKERQRKVQEKITARVNSLYAAGALKDMIGNFVTPDFNVTPDQIATEPDEVFDGLITLIEFNKEQAEAARLAAIQPVPEPQPVASEPMPAQSTTIPTQATQAPVLPPAVPSTASSATTIPSFVGRGAPQPFRQNNNSMPPQHVAGFEDCRRKMLAILASPDKFTRAELVQKIKDLK